MGAITRGIAGNLTTGGVFIASAINNTSVGSVTSFASVPSGGSLKLLQTQNASSSATIDFTSNIDATYKSYMFRFYNIHLATDGAEFEFQADTGTNTNYNQTITSTYFLAEHTEASGGGAFSYQDSRDQAQGTAFQHLGVDLGTDADQGCSGFMQIFEPASTTFRKDFICQLQQAHQNDLSLVGYIAGYFNTTTAITRFRFKASSGNVDSGTIKLYGVS